MRITILSPPFNMSGGLRVIAIYADRLTRRGHDVVVVAPPAKQPHLRRKLASLASGRGWPMAPSTQPSHFDELDVECRILDTHRPIRDADVPDADVVIATWWETAEWAAALPPSKGAKVIFIQGYEIFPDFPVERIKATWRLPFHKIVISNWLAKLARDEYRDPNFSLVPNSVDHDQFWATPREKNRTPTVGLLYSTGSCKGYDVSLRALSLCSQHIPDLRVVTFGAKPLEPSHPLPQNAEFILSPRQDELRTIYAQCDVWLCGSRSEGFHLPPSEAMACRCPVVSTRVGGPMDIIRDGENGYLVDVGDVEELANRLVTVLSLPDPSWRAMSDAALETVTRYSWDDATKLFEAALISAIENER